MPTFDPAEVFSVNHSSYFRWPQSPIISEKSGVITEAVAVSGLPACRVAIVTDANTHVGPDLARKLAERNHALIVGDPTQALINDLQTAKARFEVVTGVADLTRPEAFEKLLDAALSSFGRIDAACIRTGRIVTGDVFSATTADLEALTAQNVTSVLHALQILLPVMVQAESGQLLVVTSAAGAKPQPGAALYSATRAAANMLIKNAALSVANHGVTVNGIGTNFLDYPGFVEATGASDPKIRANIEAMVPLGRLGQPQEVAHFCASLLDGGNTFQTGQFFSMSGGWSL